MTCLYCSQKTSVTNSRSSKKTKTTWRRRQCNTCQAITTSRECYELDTSLRIKQKTGTLQPFLRDKLFISVYQSLSHRKTPTQDASGLTDTIIEHLLRLQNNGLLEVSLLRDTATTVLRQFDTAAYTHYTAHHTSD